MLFSIGDLVSRNSHNNDIVFRIKSISSDNTAILEGINLRLVADSDLSDLKKEEKRDNDDLDEVTELIRETKLDRDEYFYLPGKVLHIDADKNYLDRCMNLYKKMNIMAYGLLLEEDEIEDNIDDYLLKIKPDIVVITGHDAHYSDDTYKNSNNFINSIKKVRNYEKSQEKLIVIAGACQSNYEELIKAGANFASSPKRINIHALDPAIVASKIAFSERHKPIDLKNIINSTKYKQEGFGGIITNGIMYEGYPR